MTHQLGTRYDTVPIPPVPEHTTWFDAGAIRLGIEFRQLDDTILDEAFAGRADEVAIIDAARPEALDDEGWSIHVLDAESGDEWLRFDLFADGPHYHYIVPGRYNLTLDYDPYASGEDVLEWALDRVRERLPAMLRYAGAEELAAKVDPTAVGGAVAEVRRHVLA